ncbi:hypothetical protein SRB5_28660 [Streptomyces sp. RB5]|uniref:Uncharacterized protein n=1 Tax=Streptomyces smaragdinus TaxID=2585196 RepID=A0A7K0CGX4_9ACTN|nr:DUF5819 family protein [Streptomyces smaragdinus]MQY12727.1 hypothetical protein [Streptomyces smaragdinus]
MEPQEPPAGAGPAPGADETPPDDGGPARLSLASRIVISVTLAAVAVAAAIHLGMVFLHVAPPNTLSKENGELVREYIYPEFEQNWKLFAPNPLQTNIAVEVRARVTDANGTRETRWLGLSAQDAADIRHNPFPSHTQQNELRRAWEFFVDSHTQENEPAGDRGRWSRTYLTRVVMNRLGPELDGAHIQSIQLRGAYTPVAAPSWSDEKTDTRTTYRTLPWWRVVSDDLPREDVRRWESAGQ